MNSTMLTLHELALAREEYCALLEGAMTMPDRDTPRDDAAMWQAAYSDKCTELEQVSQRLRETAAEREAARRWAHVWKRLVKKMGFVIRNYRTGKIYQVQQGRIEALEAKNGQLQRVILAAYDYVSGTFMETGPLKALCDELARKGTP